MTPSLVLQSLINKEYVVAGLKIQRPNMGTYLALEKIQSVLVKKPSVEPVDPVMDLLRSLFILTHPSKECIALLEKGEEAFNAAILDFADKIPAVEMKEMMAGMSEPINDAFSTAIDMEVPSSDGKKKSECAPTVETAGS